MEQPTTKRLQTLGLVLFALLDTALIGKFVVYDNVTYQCDNAWSEIARDPDLKWPDRAEVTPEFKDECVADWASNNLTTTDLTKTTLTSPDIGGITEKGCRIMTDNRLHKGFSAIECDQEANALR